ncbi:MAG: globin [Phototrophicaceae bacterium]
MSDTETLFDAIGGEETITRLVDYFYHKVENDPILMKVFPSDLEAGKVYQRLFLIQVFGGPNHYSQLRGHPRLRMRHMPFPIDQQARDLWVGYMLEAIDAVGIQEPYQTQMREYMENGATFMINQPTERT